MTTLDGAIAALEGAGPAVSRAGAARGTQARGISAPCSVTTTSMGMSCGCG